MGSVGARIEVIESAPFAENSYVLWRDGSHEAIVVDPGFDDRSILRWIEQEDLQVVAILNTHGHADHIAGNAALKRHSPAAPLLIGRDDAALLLDPVANLSAGFGVPLTSPPADRLVEAGEVLDLAGFRFEVREIPGHSPGSVVYLCRDFDPPFVLGGDVLFRGSVGRTDFPGSSASLLYSGIWAKLFDLSGATIIHPGHGPSTTVDRERRTNPFVGVTAEPFEPS